MEKLEENAIEILHMICSNSPGVVSDSGGKDSSVLKHIAMKAHEKYGFQFSIRHNHTTVDAPETVYFVREEKKRYESMGIQYIISYPPKSMWQLIVENVAPPTRLWRYCCEELKERSGELGERLITGVRKAESVSRAKNQAIATIPKPKAGLKKETEENKNFRQTDKGGIIVLNLDNAETRRTIESCFRTHKVLINPLIDWDDEFLWWYIKHENICLNPRYKKKSVCRVGCIGCPMAGDGRWEQFREFPTYKQNYIKAFDRMLIERERRGLENRKQWETGLKVFKWWMEDKNMDGQLAFDEMGQIYEQYTDNENYR